MPLGVIAIPFPELDDVIEDLLEQVWRFRIFEK